MFKSNLLSILVIYFLCLNTINTSFADVIKSDMPSKKVLQQEGDSVIFWQPQAITSVNKISPENTLPKSFTELTNFILRSPDQDEAGSCLYMAITGIVEWWLAKLHPETPIVQDGAYDLSERYLMGIAGMEEDNAGLPDWRTDSIYLFNLNGNKCLKNTTYRFTKGWYKGETYSKVLYPAKPYEEGASYGTLFNWINQIPTTSNNGYVNLPLFEREIIFADPEHNQWNVGVTPANIVETVKNTLLTKKAPILVIYNHNSYWHAVYIIGYDDNAYNYECRYTENFRTTIVQRALELEEAADEATDLSVKEAYTIRAKRAREAKDKIEKAYAKNDGCTSSYGGFLIRDSIYPDENGPFYDYDLSISGEEAPYSKKIVLKEYDWLRYFANHISVITTK
ncbi:MAG: hypothetical protein HQK49_20470 [Oligoflexia bacterium]|nr:hypothetical protein [Oligoflexia bacterium]